MTSTDKAGESRDSTEDVAEVGGCETNLASKHLPTRGVHTLTPSSQHQYRAADLPKQSQQEGGFGEKNIGFWGSVCLLANNITGPGMVQIPVLFQQAGWLIPTLCFGYIGVLAGLTSLFLSKAVSQVPGNHKLQQRMEFSNLAKLLFPRSLYLLVFVALIFNFQVSNMSAIVVSAQTMDATIMAIAGKTCGVVVYDPGDGSLTPDLGGAPASSLAYSSASLDAAAAASEGSSHLDDALAATHLASQPSLLGNGTSPPTAHNGWQCVSADGQLGGADSPFGNAFVISIGYVITMAVTIPMGFMNLDDNIWVQYGGFVLLCVCVIAWCIQFFVTGLDTSRMPSVHGSGMGAVLPTVVFNWGFLTTLPSWLNEKSPNVSVSKATWVSIAISMAMFMALGILGGLGLDYPNGEDLLVAMNDPSNANVNVFSKVATYIFPSAALLSGIPVLSIIIRYNLLENHIMNKFWSNMFAVVFPWVVSLAFYPGTSLADLINWSSAILFVFLNFVLPLMLYISVNSESGRSHLVKRMVSEGLLKLNADAEAGLNDTIRADKAAARATSSIRNWGSAGKLMRFVSAASGVGDRHAETVSEKRKLLSDVGSAYGYTESSSLIPSHQLSASSTSHGNGMGTAAPTAGAAASDNGSGYQSSFLAPDLSSPPDDRHHYGGQLYGHRSRFATLLDRLPDGHHFNGSPDIAELPSWWCRCCGRRTEHATGSVWLWSSAVIGVICLLLQIISAADKKLLGSDDGS